MLEQRLWTLVLLLFGVSSAAAWLGGAWWLLPAAALATPLLSVVLPLMYLVLRSHRQAEAPLLEPAPLRWRDARLAERYRGTKLPITTVYEAYVAGELDLDISQHDERSVYGGAWVGAREIRAVQPS